MGGGGTNFPGRRRFLPGRRSSESKSSNCSVYSTGSDGQRRQVVRVRNQGAAAGAYNGGNFTQQCATLIPAEVRMISGCHSEQTSADVSNVSSISNLPYSAGRAGGACTSALLDILYRYHYNQRNYATAEISFQDLLLQLRRSLSNSGMTQIPQLTSSRPLDLRDTPFRLGPSNFGSGGVARALLVGINYRGQSGELSGCHNDVENMKRYIMDVHGYRHENVVMLVDSNYGGTMAPTRRKIIEELRRLVAVSRAGDSVYFHYSGHGGLLSPHFNAFKTSSKQYDETIYPVDHEISGQIRDFSLFNHFVKPMPAGVTVTCVMDCCHSGTVLDLPYSFRPTAGGEIHMRQSMDHLQNLAFLYMMAGGVLPHGFENIVRSIGTVVGDVSDFIGVGMEHLMNDGVAPEDLFQPLQLVGHSLVEGLHHIPDHFAQRAPVVESFNIDPEPLPPPLPPPQDIARSLPDIESSPSIPLDGIFEGIPVPNDQHCDTCCCGLCQEDEMPDPEEVANACDDFPLDPMLCCGCIAEVIRCVVHATNDD